MEEAQRQAALAVRAVHAGATVSAALAGVAASGDADGGRRRALVQELTYGTLRHWGTLDALVRELAAKPITEPALRALIAVALYQLLHTRAPAFAIVDHAVAAVPSVARPAAQGMANAMLRRFLRERDALLAKVLRDPVARYSYPAWWIGRVQRDFPDAWSDVLDAGNLRPPLTLRTNVRVITRDALVERFRNAAIATTAVGANALIVDAPRPVTELPGYDEGAFSVQDAGAQLAAPLLDLAPGMRVLDACAAPGGKSTHIAELADVSLLCLDESPARLERIEQNFARLRLDRARVEIRAADAAQTDAWWDGRAFDRILADVPCTASGVVRRHPDAKWLRRKTDLAGFAVQQARLLEALWPLLAPGGMLLYATCSLFREENDARIDAFLATRPDAVRVEVSLPAGVLHRAGQLLPSLAGAAHPQDGFFYALLRKAEPPR